MNDIKRVKNQTKTKMHGIQDAGTKPNVEKTHFQMFILIWTKAEYKPE